MHLIVGLVVLVFFSQQTLADPNPFTIPFDFNCQVIHAQISDDPKAAGILADYLIDKGDIRGNAAANLREIKRLEKSDDSVRRRKMTVERIEIGNYLIHRLRELNISDVVLDDMFLIKKARINEPYGEWLRPIETRIGELKKANPGIHFVDSGYPTRPSEDTRAITISNQKTFDQRVQDVPGIGPVRIRYRGKRLLIQGPRSLVGGEIRYVVTNHDTGKVRWGLTTFGSRSERLDFPNGKLPQKVSVSVEYIHLADANVLRTSHNPRLHHALLGGPDGGP